MSARTGLFNRDVLVASDEEQHKHVIVCPARIEVGLVSDFETGQRALYARADYTEFYKYNWVDRTRILMEKGTTLSLELVAKAIRKASNSISNGNIYIKRSSI